MRRLLKPRRVRLQASTVIATVALFVALGGTSYAVTGGTPFAWIDGSQIEDHTVTGVKLMPHTVTGGDLNFAGFPRVPAARTAEQANTAANATNAVNAVTAQSAQTAASANTAQTITGKISASQVSGSVASAVAAQSAQTAQTAASAASAATAQTITGTINANQVSGSVATANSATNAASATNATNAASATNATNAANATNATFVDGDQFVNISVSSSSASDTTLHAIAGLTLSMRCTGGNADIDATTSVSSASYGMSSVANGVATSFVRSEGSFNTGATITSTIAAPSQVSFSYEGGGKVASGTLTVYDNAGTCSAFGVAEYS